MLNSYRLGELVFYYDGSKRTLACVREIYPDKNELNIYYLNNNYDMLNKSVDASNIRKAIRGRDRLDVINKEVLKNEELVRKKLIELADINISEFKDTQGGSRKSKRRKSRHHKKTNRRRKSNRRKRSKLNIKSKF